MTIVWELTLVLRIPENTIFWNSEAAPASQPLFYIYYYGCPYVQGQLTEVSINFRILTIKVVGKIILTYFNNTKIKL